MTTNTNDLQLLAIPSLMKKHFFIPDYQRGYRWTKDQIYQLLRDLWNYFEEGTTHTKDESIGFYCLQPIVVKECSPETIEKYKLPDISSNPEYDSDQEQFGPKNNVWYEVIDGQQRLTTIRLIIALYKTVTWGAANCIPYELKYATRPELGGIFDNIRFDAENKTASINSGFNFKNVDVEYVRNAAELLLKWFLDDTQIETKKLNQLAPFLGNFYSTADKKVSVQVIWYETKEGTDARDIFERLNNLKVPLSSSELIRALFLSKNAEYKFTPTDQQIKELTPEQIKTVQQEDRKKKQDSINAKWDEIEHFFRNRDLWGFITTRDAADYRNRIEVLFDLMSGKFAEGQKAKEEDHLYTFTYFDKQADDLWALWEKVIKYYDTIRFWHEENDSYHKIGYLIHECGDAILVNLLKYANSGEHKNHEFIKELDDEIRKTIHTDKPFSQLSYDATYDYGVLKSLLFLYNVEYTRQLGKETRFPFADYNSVERKNGWTLEHIHAQDSMCLDSNKRKEWLDWASYTIDARESILNPEVRESELINDLKDIKTKLEEDLNNNTTKVNYEAIVDLFNRDLALWSGDKPYEVMHLLSNLALLGGDINTGIGKGAFSLKQQYVNKCIADGKYIPICTQKVFLKHYYKSTDTKSGFLHQQLITWDDHDRQCYLGNIKTVLGYYFTPDKF